MHVNASWSAGAWGYLALPLFGDPQLGDAVLFDPPEDVGASLPYLKTVRGVPGSRVAVGPARTIVVDGRVLGTAKTRALDGRPLEAIVPGPVPGGHYFLHGPHRDSHDSRYAEIGFVPRDHIRARAVSLPDLPWLGLEGPLVEPKDRGPMSAAARRRHMALLVAVLAVLLPGAAPAKDLGVRGETWAIAEPDLLDVIEARLVDLERSGALAALEGEARVRARARIEEPPAVPGIAPATAHRTRLVDPAVVLDRDVRLTDGTLLAAAGTRLNPLERLPLRRDLLFVDGRRETEVDWALKRVGPSTVVLLAGRPLDLARRHGRPFFFDQGGRLAARFGLAATPVLIEQEGLHLRLTEVPLRDDGRRP